jgi:hypothetical protein
VTKHDKIIGRRLTSTIFFGKKEDNVSIKRAVYRLLKKVMKDIDDSENKINGMKLKDYLL